jgi:hypothetical protein
MNIAEAAAIAITNFSSEERSIPDSGTYPGRNAAVRSAMNGALQELFGKGRAWARNDARGVLIYAPTTVTIAVTQGSSAGTVTGWQAWMAGCTIVIDGESNDNQIRNNASSVTLKYPVREASGTKSAVVYHDSITMADDVLEVIDPIQFDQARLQPIQNSLRRGDANDFGFNRTAPMIYSERRATATAGRPAGFSVETWVPDAVSAPVVRLQIYPAPSAGGLLDYHATLVPPVVTDISSAGALPIPFHFMESIFLPLVIKRLRGCAFWRSQLNDQQVEDDYKNALLLLMEADPDKTTSIRFSTKF